MSHPLPKLLIALALVVTGVRAETIVGMLTPSGAVRVAGSDLRAKGVAAWPLLPGDEITTGLDGTAVVLSARAGRFEIHSNSHVAAWVDHLALHQGSVASGRMAVHLEGYSIEPEEDDSADNWFVVAKRDGRQLVAAHRGDVMIRRAGAAPVLLPAGSYAMPPEDAAQDDANGGDGEPDAAQQGKQAGTQAGGAAGTAAGAAASSGWTIGVLGHGASIALVVSAGAAAGTATAVGVAGEETLPAQSPSSQ